MNVHLSAAKNCIDKLRDHGCIYMICCLARAEYIEEAFPDPPMLPRQLNARAKARERSRFHDTRLEPALRTLFPIVKAGGGTVEQIDAATDGITARLAQLSRMLKDPLAPTGMLTLGDCGLPVTFDWIDAICGGLKAPIEWPERVTDYRAWLDTIPAVKAELEARHPIMREWVDARLG